MVGILATMATIAFNQAAFVILALLILQYNFGAGFEPDKQQRIHDWGTAVTGIDAGSTMDDFWR